MHRKRKTKHHTSKYKILVENKEKKKGEKKRKRKEILVVRKIMRIGKKQGGPQREGHRGGKKKDFQAKCTSSSVVSGWLSLRLFFMLVHYRLLVQRIITSLLVVPPQQLLSFFVMGHQPEQQHKNHPTNILEVFHSKILSFSQLVAPRKISLDLCIDT